MLGSSLTSKLQERLTHLSVCNVKLPCCAHFIQAVSHLVNLQYLLFHQQGEGYGLDTVRPVPCEVFHNLLLSLKKLKHLSWGMRGEPPAPLPDNYLSPSDPEHTGETEGHYYLSPSDPESPGETDGHLFLSAAEVSLLLQTPASE